MAKILLNYVGGFLNWLHINEFSRLILHVLISCRLNIISYFIAAVFKGDWKSAERFIEKDPSVLTKPKSVLNRTALLAVACEGNWEFMEELVNVMDANDLGMVDELGCTALHYAAVGGSIKACRL